MRFPTPWFCYCREAVVVLEGNVSNESVGVLGGDNDAPWRIRRQRPRSVPPHLLNGSIEREESSEPVSRLRVEASSPILSARVLGLVSPSVKVSVSEESKSPVEGNHPESEVAEEPKGDESSLKTQWHSKTRSLSAAAAISPTITVEAASPRVDSHAAKTKETAENDSDNSSESSGISSESETEDDEDDTEGPPDIKRRAPDLNLRPENAFETDYGSLASLPNPVCFDFDALNCKQPAFNYPYPLPSKFRSTDFRRLMEIGQNWRNLEDVNERSFSESERTLLDRICDFERLQIATEQQEGNRRDQLRRAYRDNQEQVRRLRSQGATPGRIASATRRHPPSKQCCSTCLQPACVGDCPAKTTRPRVCVLCRQPYCEGTCANTSYEEHQRDVDGQGDRGQGASSGGNQSGIADRRSRPAHLERPRSCNSCRSPVFNSSHRLLNANSIVLGRPDSQRATFVAGARSKRPSDLRPPAPTPSETPLKDNRAPYRHLSTMIRKFEALGMSPTAPPPRLRRRARPRGRNGVEPGKSRQSCRRDSLTLPAGDEPPANSRPVSGAPTNDRSW